GRLHTLVLLPAPATPRPYPLPLHDALPIFPVILEGDEQVLRPRKFTERECARLQGFPDDYRLDVVSSTRQYRAIGNSICVPLGEDRKSTRLNSSHVKISYAVSCLQQNNDHP